MEIVDLYCGAGGLSKGFSDVGFKITSAIDNDPIAVDHYNKNLHNLAIVADITNFKSLELPDVDGIIGGPPCQAFSIAGQRLVTDPRSSLSLTFIDIVTKKKPRFFVMENVDGLLSLDIRNVFIERFKKAGYRNTKVTILNAVDYGVPQFRRRLFFTGFLNNKGALGLLPDRLSPAKRRTVRQTLRKYEYEWYYRHPRTYGRRGVYSIDEPSPTIRTVNRPMPPNYRRHPNDAPYVKEQVRALTAEERALLQTFPADYVWFGPKTKKETLIGNAVPPKLARIVARSIEI
ncbi:DNA cytosine methyltransferase [Thermoproteota archaeon]